MNHILIFILLMTTTYAARAQDVVKWTYAVQKLSERSYQVKITAQPQEPWHIYSSATPDGGPLPTSISFVKNPLVATPGKLNEKGKIVQKYEDVFGVNVKYFDGTAEFTQLVNLKRSVKTNLSGSVEYMACTDEQCLPPQTVHFTIRLE